MTVDLTAASEQAARARGNNKDVIEQLVEEIKRLRSGKSSDGALDRAREVLNRLGQHRLAAEL